MNKLYQVTHKKQYYINYRLMKSSFLVLYFKLNVTREFIEKIKFHRFKLKYRV